MSDRESVNTDRELFRENPDDYSSPRVFVTQNGSIGIDVGGKVCVLPIREWHKLAWTPVLLTPTPSDMQKEPK